MSQQPSPIAIAAPPPATVRGWSTIAARIAGSYAVVGGAITLAGWILDREYLADWDRDGIAMFANTAVCAMLCGLVLLLATVEKPARWRRNVLRIAAGVAALIGGLTLFEHISGTSLGIDTVLFPRPWGQRASVTPMRMGPPAAFSFLMLGCGLMLSTYGVEKRRLASGLGVLAVVIASLSLTGYWFGADQLFVLARLTAIASQTSTMLAGLGLGLIFMIPEHGLMAAFRRDDVGGVLIRRLLLPIIVMPLLFGQLQLLGQHAGLYDAAFGTAVFVLAMIGMLMALLLWTANSITRQAQFTRAAELALRERDARLRSTFDQAAVGMAVAALDGSFLELNQKFADILGYTANELYSMKVIEVTHPADKAQTQDYLRQLLAGEIPNYVCEKRYLRKNGDEVWSLTTVAVLKGEAGDAQRFIGVIEDITARKRAEQQLKDADRRKDEFLATLAHELRNPLAPIRNMLEIMKRTDEDADAQARAREVIDRQLNQLVRLVDDLLDMSRITRDRLELRTESIELASVIHQAIEVCRPLLDEFRHELKVNLPSAPIHLNADPVRLGQVFGNLINNACKYTPARGRIDITASRDGGDVRVAIADGGIGIESETLPNIFNMFAQGEGAEEKSRGGLGIGLTLAKRLVEMHGGSVIATSAGRGRGSEFVVRLPQASELPNVPLPQLEKTVPAASRRILVVDDNHDAAKSLSLLLKVLGNETFTSHDGLDALQTAARVRPEIVLLDIGMPKMSGYEVCRAMRDCDWGKNITIVALTGWGQEEDRRKSVEAGFDRHLVKPASLDMLISLLAESSSGRLIAEEHPPKVYADEVQLASKEPDG
jgi:PAS domain S-box-containing protein